MVKVYSFCPEIQDRFGGDLMRANLLRVLSEAQFLSEGYDVNPININ